MGFHDFGTVISFYFSKEKGLCFDIFFRFLFWVIIRHTHTGCQTGEAEKEGTEHKQCGR